MRIRDFLCVLGSGVLFGIGFLVPAAWLLVFFGVVSLLYLVHSQRRTRREAFFYGWLAGFVLHLCALSAIFWGTLPIDWFGVHSFVLQILLVGISWIASAATLAFGTGLFLLLVSSHAHRSTTFYYTAVPLVWVATEWAGAIFFSIVFAGPGSLIGAHFSIGHIGYVLGNDIALAQVAWLGGVHLLSAIAIVGGVCVYRFAFTASHRERIVIAGCVPVAIAAVALGHIVLSNTSTQNASAPVTIAIVSSNAPPRLYLTKEEEQERADRLTAVLTSIPSSINVVLLPESATFGRFNNVSTIPFPLIIDSEHTADAAGASHSNAAFHYLGGEKEESGKQFILPIGEYIPYIYRVGLALFGSKEFVNQVLTTRSFVSGSKTQFALSGNAHIAVRFCDEVMSPTLYANDAKRGASILGNISSYSWFHGSRAVFDQMQLMARVRTIESRRYYAQSGNMAAAYVLDSYGRTVGETRFGEYDSFVTTVPSSTSTTPYMFVATILPLLFALVIAVSIWKIFSRKQ